MRLHGKRTRSQRLQGFTRMNRSVRRPTKSKTGEPRTSQQEAAMLKSYQMVCTAKICHRSDDWRSHRFCRFLRQFEPETKLTSLYILTAGGRIDKSRNRTIHRKPDERRGLQRRIGQATRIHRAVKAALVDTADIRRKILSYRNISRLQ